MGRDTMPRETSQGHLELLPTHPPSSQFFKLGFHLGRSELLLLPSAPELWLRNFGREKKQAIKQKAQDLSLKEPTSFAMEYDIQD